jgi:hypothetical protein
MVHTNNDAICVMDLSRPVPLMCYGSFYKQDANVMDSNLLEAMVGGTLINGKDVATFAEQFGKKGASKQQKKNKKNKGLSGTFSSRFVFLVTNQHLAPFVLQNDKYARVLQSVFGTDIFSIAARFLLRPALPSLPPPSAATRVSAAPSFAERLSNFGRKLGMPWFTEAAEAAKAAKAASEGGDVASSVGISHMGGSGMALDVLPRLFIGVHVRTGMTENEFDAWILRSYVEVAPLVVCL